MKIYDVEIPSDLEIPELDEQSKAEIDALHEEIEREGVKRNRTLAESPYKDWGPKPLTEEEAWQLMNPDATGPRPPPTVNVEALRKLPPRVRAIFAYIFRANVTR